MALKKEAKNLKNTKHNPKEFKMNLRKVYMDKI